MATIIKKGTPKKEFVKIIDRAVRKTKKKKIADLAGTLKSKPDPLEYQKSIRDEWE